MKYVLFFERTMLAQLFYHFFRNIACKFHSHGCKFFAQLYNLFHLVAIVQVLVIHLAYINVGVSCDSQNRFFFYFIAFKRLWHKVQYQLLGQDIIAVRIRNGDEPRQKVAVTRNYADSLFLAL